MSSGNHIDTGEASLERRLDVEWTTLSALREMLGIALKGTQTPTYRQALDLGKVVAPSLFDSESSLLGKGVEPALVEQYREKADGLSQIEGHVVNPLDLLEKDIELNKRIIRTEGTRDQVRKQLSALERARPYFLPREYTENQLIIRDVHKAERPFPSPPIDGDTYRDFELSEQRRLRIRSLHPDPPEHSLGADLIYEHHWEKKRLVRLALVQYKIWDGKRLYLSQARGARLQMEKLHRVLCDKNFCSPPDTDKDRTRFRLPYCAAFLRPTDKLQEPGSRLISSGLHIPVCRALASTVSTNQGGEKIERKIIRSESISHKVFEEMFNVRILGTRWLTYDELWSLYSEHNILRPEEKVIIHGQEFGLD